MLNIAKSDKDIGLVSNKINRHGLITGATGTGKTVTLKVMAEQLSKNGIPVFVADIKGDLASLSEVGTTDENIASRLEKLKITDYENQAFPVRLWDIFGTEGTPIRATISEMGPTLLSRLLNLNDTQTGIMNIVFKIADENGYLLLDLKDLQAILQEVGNNASEYTLVYGNVTKQSVGAIQRSLLALEQQNAHDFFGEPAIKLTDFIAQDASGKGVINILMARTLFNSPLLYSTFLMWLLSELFENLEEVGDLEKPKLVFFFDEAHLLFNGAPKAFVEQVVQVVKLIRSKGIGVYFISQNPIDIPEEILGQLSNRVQHALRAFTPNEIKAIKAASDTFRQNPEIDTMKVISELKTGEALVSFLNEDGEPSMVERAFIRPPESKMSAIDPMMIPSLINSNPFEAQYRDLVDRESAYELLSSKANLELQAAETELQEKEAAKLAKEQEKQEKAEEKERLKEEREKAKEEKKLETARKNDPLNRAKKTLVDTFIRKASSEITRGIFDVLNKK